MHWADASWYSLNLRLRGRARQSEIAWSITRVTWLYSYISTNDPGLNDLVGGGRRPRPPWVRVRIRPATRLKRDMGEIFAV
jgi:hypothetical protein